MIIEIIKTIFARDLDRLYNEISLYQKEANIWKTENQIANSAGNLCLHLIGNLNTYIGKEIGGYHYIRNREAEFSLKNVSKRELLEEVKKTSQTVIASLNNLQQSDLEKQYPILVFDKKTSTGYLLIHLTTHLTYHLGQINYHRRLIDTQYT
ncbi:DinB family protein [Sediminibacterium goheungense]|uniref:Uncharacterized protein DUF1572 n=1 Tax=Sediminibacterium goheungense TaxID=1086393 RepID=A0A4R6IRM3_9BACT|nr:DinB family protein [Sediminibacterium goheungense]TDO23497.1 uncharacterized protein DUF1572 [Sediminibacterium goheungense]TDO25100.1 uncharacterized protein DUF1572 [Sediminibacterium goheungense]